MIFNSQGSNYNLGYALRHLFTRGSQQDIDDLKDYLETSYGGQVEFYYHGRSALHKALKLSSAKQVVVNAITCWAVEQAVQMAGAQPLFADVEPGCYHFGIDQLKKLHQSQPEIGAVIVQATFGLPIDIAPIESYCRQQRLVLIEDLAHSVGMNYQDGRLAGTVGDLVMLSFGKNKQLDVVNGGVLVIRSKFRADQQASSARASLTARLQDRLYPLISCWLRLSYSWFGLGKACQWLAGRLGLVIRSADEPPMPAVSLPAYKARLVLSQFKKIAAERLRRRRLWRAYEQQPAPAGANPLRYLFKLDQDISLVLDQLTPAGYSLNDQWLQTPIYPARYYQQSSYQPGSCPQAEKLTHGKIIELPLNRQMTAAKAKRLVKLLTKPASLKVVAPETESTWQQALSSWPDRHFPLNWLYGQTKQDLGKQVIRRLVYRQETLVAVVQAVIQPARQGRYLEVVSNPLLLDETDQQVNQLVIGLLKALARQHSCGFVRLWMRLEDNPERRQRFGSLGLKPSPLELIYHRTSKIDLTLSEETLLANMTKQTRYSLRQADKTGIRVASSTSSADFDKLLDAVRQTAAAQNFNPGSTEILKQQWQPYLKAKQACVYHAYSKDNQLLASALIIFSDVEASYYWHASTEAGRSSQAAYAIQWRAIRDAKAAGKTNYDLWRVSSLETTSKVADQTIFKLGFGGKTIAYLPSYDLIVNRLTYRLAWLVGIIRSKQTRS